MVGLLQRSFSKPQGFLTPVLLSMNAIPFYCLRTLAWMNDCKRNSSLHRCSIIPMYCRMLLSVTPAWPPSSSVIAALSQLALLNNDSTPAIPKFVLKPGWHVERTRLPAFNCSNTRVEAENLASCVDFLVAVIASCCCLID